MTTAAVEGLPASPVAIVGLGVSGRATARYLLDRGVRAVGMDAHVIAEPDPELRELMARGLEVRTGAEAMSGLGRFATVFVTPGMRKDHPALAAAARSGATVTGEIPYVLARSPVPVLGITGSAGKTTTTSLVGAIARRAGVRAFVGGNIGLPAIQALSGTEAYEWLVLELSSFQLDLCRVSPRVGCLLNLAPNHLDVHPDMDDYRRAKLNILRHQGAGDVAILNADRPVSGAAEAGAPARRLLFGLDPARVPEGATVTAGRIVVRDGANERPVMAIDGVPLLGRHNLENALAAALLGTVLGAPLEAIEEAVRSFPGVPHRLERVHEEGGVRFVDDSIATSPDRTIAALEALGGPIVLIAGGSDKGLTYDVLGPYFRRYVRVLVTMGPTGPAIARASASAGGPRAIECKDLPEAVARARAEARNGDTVLLAPASASFDQFPNYAARGDAFRHLVREAAPSAS